MRYIFSILIFLLASAASAQSVKLPAEIKVQPGRLASVLIEYDGDDVRWTTPPELDVFREYDPDAKKIRLRLIGYTAGKSYLHAVAAKGGKLSDFATCLIIVGEPPDPGPKPPVPPEGPFGGAPGLHVLIVYESEDNLSKEHHSIVHGKQFRDYIESKVARDGKSLQRRIYDKDVVMTGETKLWQNAMARPRSAIPWIAIGNGKNWHEGPLPSNEDEAMALLKKYGG